MRAPLALYVVVVSLMLWLLSNAAHLIEHVTHTLPH
jgi:hypothetical protein